MSLELTGMRELSVEELTLVSGGDGTATAPLVGQIPGYTPDPSVLNNIAYSGGFSNVLPPLGHLRMSIRFLPTGPNGVGTTHPKSVVRLFVWIPE